jgi:hypothetical protein
MLWIGLVTLAVIIAAAVVLLTGAHSGGEGGGEVRQSRERPPGAGHTFASLDCWVGTVHGQQLVVYAGAKVLAPAGTAVRSELLVFATPSAAGAPKFDGAFTPPGGGREPLKIISASGDVLKVQTRSGADLYFDVARRAFVTE